MRILENDKIEDLMALQQMGQKQLQPESDYFENEAAKFKKFVIENDKEILPTNIAKKFWVFTDKEMSLTNFDIEDIRRNLLWFDIVKIDYQMSRPAFEFTFEEAMDIDSMRVKGLAKMKRSFGGLQRERALMATEIKEIRTSEKNESPVGVLGRIFGGLRK